MITICRFPVLAKVFDTFTGTYLFWEETKNIAFERNQGRGNCFKVFLQISKYVYVEKLGSSRQPPHSPSLLAGCHQPQLKSLRNRQICRLKSVKKNRNRVEKQSLSFWRIPSYLLVFSINCSCPYVLCLATWPLDSFVFSPQPYMLNMFFAWMHVIEREGAPSMQPFVHPPCSPKFLVLFFCKDF